MSVFDHFPEFKQTSLVLGQGSSSSWFQQHSPASIVLEYQQQILQQQQQQQQQQEQSPPSSSSLGRPVCHFCRKELKNIHSLNVHISRYHSETNESSIEVICPVCERKYGNKYSLRTHMHLNHKDQLHLLGTAKKGSQVAIGKKTGVAANEAETAEVDSESTTEKDAAESSEKYLF